MGPVARNNSNKKKSNKDKPREGQSQLFELFVLC